MDSYGDVRIGDIHSQTHNDLDHHLFDSNMNNISANSANSMAGAEGSDFLSSFFPIDHQDGLTKSNSNPNTLDPMDVEFPQERDQIQTRQDRRQSPRDTDHNRSSNGSGSGNKEKLGGIREGGAADGNCNSEAGGAGASGGGNNSQNPSLAGTGLFLGNMGIGMMPLSMLSPTQMPLSAPGNMDLLNGMSTAGINTGISNMGMGGVMAALQSLSANGGMATTSSGSASSPGGSGGAEGQGQLSQQIMLEQFKLAQLHQLQQLQNQIFQQQMALINGGTGIAGGSRSGANTQTSSDASTPIATAGSTLDAHQRDQQQRSNQYHSLPTPGSSAELRATSHPIPIDFVSPMILSYNELDIPGSSSMSSSSLPQSHPDPHHSHSQSRPHSVTHTPVFPPHDPSMGGIEMDLDGLAPLTPLSTHYGGSQSNAHAHPGHTTHTHHARASDHYLAHRGTSSAPAHIAFGNPLNMSSEPCSPLPSDLDFDISPLTSPWLGADMGMGGTGAGTGVGGRAQAYHHHHPQTQTQQHQQHQTQHHSQHHQGAGNKRTASPSGDVTGNGNNGGARKRQQSISQSPVTRPSINSTSNNAAAVKRSSRSGAPGSGSRSTNSTPLLRGTSSSSRGRRESGMGAGAMTSPMVSSPLGNPSHGTGLTNIPGSEGIGVGLVGDSPSPVDLSMPPPANPPSGASVPTTTSTSITSSTTTNANAPPSHLMPVTPASIMNLGLGSRNGNGNGFSQAMNLSGGSSESGNLNFDGGGGGGGMGLPPPPPPQAPAPPPEPVVGSSSDLGTYGKGKGGVKVKETGTGAGMGTGSTSIRRSGRKAAASTSATSNLKTLLPAGTTQGIPLSPLIPSTTSSTTPSVTIPAPIVPLKERKTSHKAAEQKRRDSLKTTFDDLRGLLPPIPLPTDEKFTDDGSGIGFVALAKASMLPGALPPRGPPKAGGEGPNKGVSKLQLLICGNEYIRVLRGRVERRDEEVQRLREEVRRLRGKLEGAGLGWEVGAEGEGEGEEGEEGLDLERDLDAVEVMNMNTSLGSMGMGMGIGGAASSIHDVVEEDEE